MRWSGLLRGLLVTSANLFDVRKGECDHYRNSHHCEWGNNNEQYRHNDLLSDINT